MDDATAARTIRGTSKARAYYELTKPGIAAYVMMTAGVSAYVGAAGRLDLATAVHTIVGIGLATAGALSLNQWVERDIDAVMHRTRTRPLPTRRLTPNEALFFGSLLLLAGIVYTAVALGALPALLTVASAFVYHGVYTPLKSRTSIATLAGSVPGALPMLIGWTAATGRLDLGGLVLFAIGYLWQLPHVLGLGWMLREDYARVGLRLIPPGGARALGTHLVVTTALLVPVSWLPTVMGLTGQVYMVAATVLGIAFVAAAVTAAAELTTASARRVFFASLLYHPSLMAVMLFDTIRP